VVLPSGNQPNYTYFWSPSDGLSNPFAGNPVASPTKASEYYLKVTNEIGCWTETSIKIFIFQRLLIPTIFTPNNDGNNDFGEIFGKESYPDVEVSIYNRWGEIVFFSKGYSTQFDGTYKGEPLPTGSYAYRVIAPSANYILSGGFEIMR
jgi:gliding motility-associated-like protein